MNLSLPTYRLTHQSLNTEELTLPKTADWLKALRAAKVVGKPGEFKPLILDSDARLYLHRYWKYEQDLAATLNQWASENTGRHNQRSRLSRPGQYDQHESRARRQGFHVESDELA